MNRLPPHGRQGWVDATSRQHVLTPGLSGPPLGAYVLTKPLRQLLGWRFLHEHDQRRGARFDKADVEAFQLESKLQAGRLVASGHGARRNGDRRVSGFALINVVIG